MWLATLILKTWYLKKILFMCGFVHVRVLACVCARMCACMCVPVHVRRSEYNLRVRYLPPLWFRNQIQVIRLVQHVLLPVAPSRAGHPSDGQTQENWELGESIQKQPPHCGLRWRSTRIPYKWSEPDTFLFPEHPSLKHPRSDSAPPPNKSTPHFRAEPASCLNHPLRLHPHTLGISRCT